MTLFNLSATRLSDGDGDNGTRYLISTCNYGLDTEQLHHKNCFLLTLTSALLNEYHCTYLEIEEIMSRQI